MATRGRPRGSGKGKRGGEAALGTGSESVQKKAKREQKFIQSYSQEYPCITASKVGSTYARCSACEFDFLVSHGGIDDVKKHMTSLRHIAKASTLRNTSSLVGYIQRTEDTDLQPIRAEAYFTAFLVDHNVPLSASDHAGQLFKKMFPDSNIADTYSSARTKTTSIVKECAEDSKAELVQCMKGPFVLGTDGSQEGEDKFFPIVVRAVDPHGTIKTELLSVPSCETSATGEHIFQLLDSELRAYQIDWRNCLAFVTDNANVMIGVNKGVISFIRDKHPETFLARCVCHLLSLTVKKAMKESSKFDLDDTMRQLAWYFSKSTGRQQRLKQIQKELGLPEHKVVEHVPTRWLSLGAALDRAVEQWNALDKFFKEECSVKTSHASSTSSSDPPMRQKLGDFFGRKTTKLYVLFYATVLEVFNQVNKLEQTDSARIHLIKRDMERLYRRLLVSYLKPAALNNGALMDVDFKSSYNMKRDEDIFIGSTTREHLDCVESKQQQIFMENVKTFYKEACKYMKEKLNPAEETLWKHAELVDVNLQKSVQASSLKYFLKKFPCTLPPNTTPDELEGEFLEYQAAAELPPVVLNQPSAELQWKEIGAMKDHNGATRLRHLSQFMLSILLIPVSNCGCERIFSQVRRNKTDFRGSIGAKTLDALMVLKSKKVGPCYKAVFSDELLKKCKSATKRQHTEHSARSSTDTTQ